MLARSPRILSVSWGRLEVENLGEVKDLKAWPGGARPWDWTETGTQHFPGVQPADLEELLTHGATTVVLSQGMQERLRVPLETLDFLRTRSIDFHVAETRTAVRVYNDLLDSAAVGGLFHSTC
jgi:hypothetical protein